MKHIRAICFDLDNTLWDVFPVIERAEKVTQAWLAERHPALIEKMTLESIRAMRDRIALEYPHMSHDFTFLRKQSLREHARLAGLPESVADEAFAVFYRARNEVVLYADVTPALNRMRLRRRLVSMTNGNADLEAIGLKAYFEFHIAARDAGALKPDARIFRATLERLGLDAAEVLHVGDDPSADIEGARAVGMTPVWVDRIGAVWPAELEPPAHRVRDLTELAELLEAADTLV